MSSPDCAGRTLATPRTRFGALSGRHSCSNTKSLLELREFAQEVTGALVPIGVVHQVQLVVLLGIPPLLGWEDLSDDLTTPPLLVGFLGDLLGNLLLFIVVIEDAAAILRATIGPLLVVRGGVVHLVEELEDLGVGETGGIID